MQYCTAILDTYLFLDSTFISAKYLDAIQEIHVFLSFPYVVNQNNLFLFFFSKPVHSDTLNSKLNASCKHSAYYCALKGEKI